MLQYGAGKVPVLFKHTPVASSLADAWVTAYSQWKCRACVEHANILAQNSDANGQLLFPKNVIEFVDAGVRADVGEAAAKQRVHPRGFHQLRTRAASAATLRRRRPVTTKTVGHRGSKGRGGFREQVRSQRHPSKMNSVADLVAFARDWRCVLRRRD